MFISGLTGRAKRRKEKLARKQREDEDYLSRHGLGIGEVGVASETIVYGSWARSECFKIERGLLTFG